MLLISNPRMVKEDVHFIPSSGHRMSFGSFMLLIGMTLVLSKLKACPKIVWKFWMYFVAFLGLQGCVS